MPIACDDVFGMNDLQDRLKKFCIDQSIDIPLFWIIKPDGYYMGYAVSLHLNCKDRWEEFDTKVIFVLKEFSDRRNPFSTSPKVSKGTVRGGIERCRRELSPMTPKAGPAAQSDPAKAA